MFSIQMDFLKEAFQAKNAPPCWILQLEVNVQTL